MFNLHEQFERLRADGRFDRMRDTIRRRDTDLQGSLNPMVRDHGEQSEARQYAGRAVPDRWSAPFSATEAAEETEAADATGPTDAADATETAVATGGACAVEEQL